MNIYKQAAQVRGFYDAPLWFSEEPKPEYWELFTWSPAWGDRGTVIFYKDGIEFNKNGELGKQLYGVLKEELFDTIEKKIAYLQGVFEDLSEGIGIIRGENFIQFANSQNKVERCKKWIGEVTYHINNQSKDEKGYYFPIDPLLLGGIISHKIEYYIPICHHVEIHPKVVEYIKNYKVELENVDTIKIS